MKFKRVIALAIVATTLLSGCGSNDSTKEITSANTSSAASEATTDDGTEAVTETASDDAATTEAASAEEPAGDTSIEEQVLFDANDVRITAVEYVTDTIWGDGIKVLIENNGSANVGIGCDALIVNDYMINDLFSEQVAAGKKANETIDLLTSELEAAGIDNVGKIEVQFHLFDPDTYMTTYTSDLVTIETSHYADMDTSANDDGQELYNEGGIRIVGKYVDENSFWGNAIVLYLENNTDRNICVQANDLSINGFMINGIFSSTIYSGKKAVDDVTLFQSELDENGIASVDDVELTFHIFDPDTYATIADSGVISFSTK